jgi:hypothetical protein
VVPKPIARVSAVIMLCATMAILPSLQGCGPGEVTSLSGQPGGSQTAITSRSAEMACTTSTTELPPYQVSIGLADAEVHVSAGWHGDLSFSIFNWGYRDDVYDVEISSSIPCIDMTEVPTTLALKAGESCELSIHVSVPVDQPDGVLGEVDVLARSQAPGGCSASQHIWVGVVDPSVESAATVMDHFAESIRTNAERTPPVSQQLAEAAEHLQAARSSLAESPTDVVTLAVDLHKAVERLTQCVDTLVQADAQCGTSVYSAIVEDLRNYSRVLVTIARDRVKQAIERADTAGGDRDFILAARTALGGGGQAFSRGDYVTAIAKYAEAAGSAVDSL